MDFTDIAFFSQTEALRIVLFGMGLSNLVIALN